MHGSGIQITAELNRETFKLKIAVLAILQWVSERETDRTLREAAVRALNLVQAWLGDRQSGSKQEQMSIFDDA